MDQLCARLAALEHQVQTLHQQTRTVKRQLRWWRGLAGGLGVVGLLTWGLPSGTAQDSDKGLAHRVAALEDLLKHFTRVGNEVIITGANLHLVNGLGRTSCMDTQGEPLPDCPNGLGNLIVGYNEPREEELGPDIRTGSRNVVVGRQHNFSRFGGLVVGDFNEISGAFAAVTGGRENTASGDYSSVSGGFFNRAIGEDSSVSDGSFNTATGFRSSVSGGRANTANGAFSSVSGGLNGTAVGENDWVAGRLFEDE